jgi:hypothetical protein
MLVQYKVDIIIISLNVTCSRHDTAEKLDTDKIVSTCKLHISVGSDKGALQHLHRDMIICFIS